jgi:hypothetical protein
MVGFQGQNANLGQKNSVFAKNKNQAKVKIDKNRPVFRLKFLLFFLSSSFAMDQVEYDEIVEYILYKTFPKGYKKNSKKNFKRKVNKKFKYDITTGKLFYHINNKVCH